MLFDLIFALYFQCQNCGFKLIIDLFLSKQMKPSSISSDLKASSSQAVLFQGWHKSGQCPEATIPIRRSQEYQRPHAIHHLKQRRTQLNHSFDIDIQSDHEVSFIKD